MKVRRAGSDDRDRILRILEETRRFKEDEVAAAIDLVDQGLGLLDRNEYLTYVATGEDDRVVGYACYGPTPMTDGVYDLYWIAVEPELQGKGIGAALLEFVENEVRRRAGRMLLIETSSKRSYAPTVNFYRHHGYEEISRIKDFYRIEDDKIVFCKRLS